MDGSCGDERLHARMKNFQGEEGTFGWDLLNLVPNGTKEMTSPRCFMKPSRARDALG